MSRLGVSPAERRLAQSESKKVDREFNRFLYHTLGKGHTITSVLQYMSGAKVMPERGR